LVLGVIHILCFINTYSSIAVLQAAQQLIPDASQIEHTVKQGVFKLYKVKNETSEAQWVVNKIQKIASLKNHGDIEGRAVVFIQLNSTWIKVFDEHLIHIIGR
jgi:hypothetical protein